MKKAKPFTKGKQATNVSIQLAQVWDQRTCNEINDILIKIGEMWEKHDIKFMSGDLDKVGRIVNRISFKVIEGHKTDIPSKQREILFDRWPKKFPIKYKRMMERKRKRKNETK